MAPKGGNTKQESGRAKKAANEAQKKAAAETQKEKAVEEDWQKGAKGKSAREEKEEKRRAELARKAENAKLLAEEEEAVLKPKPKANVGAKGKGKEKPAGPGAIAASPDDPAAAGEAPSKADDDVVESFAATGIDEGLQLLEVVNAKMDKASIGQQAAEIERHPERRFKASFEAYVERELPQLKIERPGLRLQQYKDLLYKQFQKSPDNPFNQATVEYNATRDEKVEALKTKRAQTEEQLREKQHPEVEG